jgi:Tfp pilus assembly protein PilV
MSTFSRPRSPSSQAGFFLIEVLVAVTLLAVGVTAALNAIFNCLKATSETRMYTQALFLAQRIMSELEARTALNDDFDVPHSGTFEDAPHFRWQASSHNVRDYWTREIAVTVIWSDNIDNLYDDDKCDFYRIVTEVPRPRYPEDYEK